MCKKYKKINRLLLVLPLMTFMTSCSDWDYNHDNSNSIFTYYDNHSRWDNQGFTLEEYRIYKAAGMNNLKKNQNSALPWKEAGIPAMDAVKYHQQWQKMNIDNKIAIYFVKRNISLDQYMQAVNALKDSNITNIVYFSEDILKVVQYIKSGMSPYNSVMRVKEEIENEKKMGGEKSYRSCQGPLEEMYPTDIGNITPFNVIGKCYILPFDIYPIKWISKKQIFNRFPPGSLSYTPYSHRDTTFYIESDEEIQPNTQIEVIGIQPKIYDPGIEINEGYVPSFHIIKYPEY